MGRGDGQNVLPPSPIRDLNDPSEDQHQPGQRLPVEWRLGS